MIIKDVQTLKRVVVIGETAESIGLEFKGRYGRGQSEEIQKDLAALANTLGGTLLIGVEEVVAPAGLKVAGKFAIIDVEQAKSMVSAAAARLVPPISVKYFPLLAGSDGEDSFALLAVVVEPVIAGPIARWDSSNGSMTFFYRDDFGVQTMTPGELALRITRARGSWLRITQLEPEDASYDVILPDGHWSFHVGDMSWHPNTRTPARILNFDSEQLEIMLMTNQGKVCIPMSSVREVWRTKEGKVSMFLDCVILHQLQNQHGAGMTWIQSKPPI